MKSALRTALRPLLIVLIVAAGLGPLAATPAAAASSSSPTAGLWALRYGDQPAVKAGHPMGYVVLQEYMRGLIPQIRAASPGVKILVYKDVAATVSKACKSGVDDAHLPAGVGYCWADRNRPDWFLKDSTGQRIEFNDYPALWYMDVANRDYQDAWAANVAAVIARDGWDGVMLDDVMTWSGHLGDRTIAKYPTWKRIEGAFESFLAAVGPRLMRSGAEVIPNIAFPWATADYVEVYKRFLTYTSGSAREFSATWNNGAAFGGEWWGFVRTLHEHTVAVGKTFLGVDYIDPARPDLMTYARASFLMGVGSSPGVIMVVPPSSSTDPWNPAWTTEMGAPIGARSVLPGGVWRRNFTSGVALANPGTSTVTVNLGGTYTAENGSPITSITLAPLQGAVLKRATPTTPTLRAKAVSPSSVRLTWTPAVGATGLRIERSPDRGRTWTSIESLRPSVRSYRSSGLTASSTYLYRVIAEVTSGSMKSNTARVTTLAPRRI